MAAEEGNVSLWRRPGARGRARCTWVRSATPSVLGGWGLTPPRVTGWRALTAGITTPSGPRGCTQAAAGCGDEEGTHSEASASLAHTRLRVWFEGLSPNLRCPERE